uniref:PID domain-containing protein n=1 Tax=Plectus sambesii TaxID=2011161 RepID=A0A914UQG4_9BILA
MAGADDQLSGSGVSYNFQYIGNIEVVTSMRSLDFDVRTNLTKECIYQVCERAKLLHGRKHAVDVRAAQLLGANPRIQLVGLNVDFVISTRALTVAHADRTQIERCGTLLLMHPLPNVSFASAGDAEMPDYVCYVAKDDNNGRRCYVYECGKQMAAQVLKTVGDAFNMRHGSLVASSQPPSASVPLLSNHPPPRSPALINFEIPVDPTPTRPAPEYVNDSAISAHHDTISF